MQRTHFSNASIFSPGEWIWCRDSSANQQYVLFCKELLCDKLKTDLKVRITADCHYEFYLNGRFAGRGPVHGDPKWQRYDEYILPPVRVKKLLNGGDRLQIVVLVYHSMMPVNYLVTYRGGLIAKFELNRKEYGTDTSWKCLELKTWRNDVPKKGWALPPYEDCDARLEPSGWQDKIFHKIETDKWENARLIENPDDVWANYQLRMTPAPVVQFQSPIRVVSIFKTTAPPPEKVEEISILSDTEPLNLRPGTINISFDIQLINDSFPDYNAFTFDLEKERIGFYEFEIDASAGTVIEVSGSELIRNGRPWIFRKETGYSMRYTCRQGRQKFTSFFWNGFRYMYMVIRKNTGRVTFIRVGCLERKVPLTLKNNFKSKDRELVKIFDLCRWTLEMGVQEVMIDCPTREQTQYWGDALFIAQGLLKGYGELAYLESYLCGFLHVPFNNEGQISSTYPGDNPFSFPDYSLIPIIGQDFYKEHTGRFYKGEETFKKSIQLRKWYERHMDKDGLVTFDFEEYRRKKNILNFIDHPGIGWHNFPHPSIDRRGTSCPLNLFYFNFVRQLSAIALDLNRPEARILAEEARRLRKIIRETFFDGSVFHDAVNDGILSDGTSWQTNGLALYFDVAREGERKKIMQSMLDGYDRLCRPSPYFYFYFLPAMKKAGMVKEALELIKKEWGKMLAGDATTTWETFSGDDRDSLCHPWSTAPFLFLLETSNERR